jgi:hypothetical protein
MQTPTQTIDTFANCLSKIGLKPSAGHLQFADGLRVIDLSEMTTDDIEMMSKLCPLLTGDLASTGQSSAAA